MNLHFDFCYAIAHFILRNGSPKPYWALKYLSYALALDFKGQDLEALLEIWEHFLKHLRDYDGMAFSIADDINSCIKSIISSGKSLNNFLSPSHLTANGVASYLVA